MWYSRGRGSRTKVQSPPGATDHPDRVLPLGTGWPLIFTFLLRSSVVAKLAPGVHTSCHFTSPPNKSWRPRART